MSEEKSISLIDYCDVVGEKGLIEEIDSLFLVAKLKDVVVEHGFFGNKKGIDNDVKKETVKNTPNQIYYWFKKEGDDNLLICFFKNEENKLNSLYADFNNCSDFIKEKVTQYLDENKEVKKVFIFTKPNTLYSKDVQGMIDILRLCMDMF